MYVCSALVGTKPTNRWLLSSKEPERVKKPPQRFLSVYRRPGKLPEMGSTEGDKEMVKERNKERKERKRRGPEQRMKTATEC